MIHMSTTHRNVGTIFYYNSTFVCAGVGVGVRMRVVGRYENLTGSLLAALGDDLFVAALEKSSPRDTPHCLRSASSLMSQH